jgi:hypothetical protein
MASRHDRLTIASIAVVASVTTVMLHEGVGHGVTAWLRGDHPTLLTSNHLSADVPDKLVSAGGTLANLVAGALAWLAIRRAEDSTLRYTLWLFSLLNLMVGAGYFLFSGVFGYGDWEAVIEDLPSYGVVRPLMAIGGGVLYALVVWRMSRALRRDYAPDPLALWLLPYVAGALVAVLAGWFDPAGSELFWRSTVPANFGGTSGLAWGHWYAGKIDVPGERVVARVPALWLLAATVALVHVAIDGPGIAL